MDLRLPRLSIIFFPLLLCVQVHGQEAAAPGYPKGYFRDPLNLTMHLSGNFGELRTNHYHMGLDIKTNGIINQPVFAAADGYVSRIKIEPFGFGQAIYIDHPNGYTTLYAHLNHFIPALEKYVEQQQYLQQSWQVMLIVPPGLFKVKKGDLIAYSGSKGGSQAPHLHFEIRRTSDDVNLNPLLFGLPVTDNVRPRLIRLGIYDRGKSIYEQSPKLYPLKALSTGKYTAGAAVIPVSSPLVSFAISAYDSHNGSHNLNGIYSGDLFVDGENVIGFKMDNISYDNTRYVNAHVDYRLKARGGPFIQHLSELPGYINSIYQIRTGNGVIDISDGKTHAVKIVAKDPYGNASQLNFRIRYNGQQKKDVPAKGKMFYPLMLDGYEEDSCEFYIGEKCLYDSVHIATHESADTHPGTVSARHYIGQAYIPLQDSILIRIRPNRNLSAFEKDHTVMLRRSGANQEARKVVWTYGWADAKFRQFGAFTLIVDDKAPVIIPIGFKDGSDLSKSSHIVFNLKDNLGEVVYVRAELDGSWLRFTNDKGRNFIYEFDNRCPKGSHVLKITAVDIAGNMVSKNFSFTR